VATEARKFQVGLFVIGATVIAVGAAIWLGASRFFENTTYLVCYLSESVQGLEPGSSVKYRGVPAGRVEKIGIAPDGDLIEVLMSIDIEFAQQVREDETLRAQLQLSGITGLRYIEIDRHTGDALKNSPKLSFTPTYSLIPSTPSSFKAIQEALEDVYEKVMAVDLAGISSDARRTLQSVENLVKDDRVQRTLTNLAEVSDSAGRVSKNLDVMTRDIDVKPVVRDLREASAEAKSLFAELRSGTTGQQLRSAIGDLDDLAHSSQQFLINLQFTLERLDRTLANFEQFTTDLRQQPSRLIFSNPPPPRRGSEEEKR
jgi:phospholipid/cholesterol/gamma-HCH transport system substrate-binding protein